MYRIRFILAFLLVVPATAAAQQRALAYEVGVFADDVQEARGEKSPVLAALLSWLVWPGVGSYYAGNSGHGTRHLVIGVASLGGAVALLATCDSDGFCDFDHDAVRLSAAITLGAVWLGNEVWSILTAITDAEQHNATLTAGPVSVNPALTRLTLQLPDRQVTRWGVELVSVRF